MIEHYEIDFDWFAKERLKQLVDCENTEIPLKDDNYTVNIRSNIKRYLHVRFRA